MHAFRATFPTAALALLSSVCAGQVPLEASADVVPTRSDAMLRLPRAVASFGGAVLDGELYVIGGHIGRTHEHSTANLASAFSAVDLASGAVRELAGGVALQGLALVSDGRQLVRVGGLSARNAPDELEDLVSSASCAAFDPERASWSTLADLPAARSSHDAAVLDGRLYVVGGWDLQGARETWHDSACVLDLSPGGNAAWSEIEQPFRRRALAVASDGERIYAIGGLDEDGKTSRRVDVYDPARAAWSAGPELPSSGFGASAFGIDGRVWLALADGGLLRLARDGSAWEPAGELVFGRMFPRLLPAPEGLLVAGGARRGGHVPWIERVALSDGEPAPSIQTLELENPTRARQRAALFVDDGSLWLVGGNTELDAHRFEPENFLADIARVELASATSDVPAQLPEARQSLTVALTEADGRTAWLVGGFGHDGEAARSHAEILALDLDTREVRGAGELPRRLTQFGSTLRGQELWLFGGLDYDPDRLEPFEHSDDIVVVDLSGETPQARTIEAGMQTTRRAFGGIELDGRFHVVGGMREDFELVEDCRVFDFASGAWSAMAAPAAPRISPDLVALGGRLYLVGGTSRGTDGKLVPDPSIEVYDPASDRWSVLVDEIPLPPGELVAFAWHDRLALCSLLDGDGRLRIAFVKP